MKSFSTAWIISKWNYIYLRLGILNLFFKSILEIAYIENVANCDSYIQGFDLNEICRSIHFPKISIFELFL